MHNWCLLILALLAASQPIATFTERNLVNGRQQCSERPSLHPQARQSLDGPDRKLSQHGHLNHRDIRDTRENRHYEVRGEDSTRISVERRTGDTKVREETRLNLEQFSRFSRVQQQRTKDSQDFVSTARSQVLTEDRLRESRESRDLYRRDREENRVRSSWNIQNVRQVRDMRRSTYNRNERSFNNEDSGSAIDARREFRRIRDIKDSRRSTEAKENPNVFLQATDEVTRIEPERKREVILLRERQGLNSISLERRLTSHRNVDTARDARHLSRIQNQNDIVNRAGNRRAMDRPRVTDEVRIEDGSVRHELRSISQDVDSRQNTNEREVRSKKISQKSFRSERSLPQIQSRQRENYDSTERRLISDRTVSKRNQNVQREFRGLTQTHDRKQDSEHREFRLNNKRSRLYTELDNKGIRERIELERTNRQSFVSQLNVENLKIPVRREHQTDDRIFRGRRMASDGINVRNMRHSIRRESKPKIRDFRNVDLEERRSNDRTAIVRRNRIESDRLALSVSRSEPKRVESRRLAQRRSDNRVDSVRDHRLEISHGSRALEEPIGTRSEIKNSGFKQSIALPNRNRNTLTLIKNKDGVDANTFFNFDWKYVLYTLQIIYVSNLLVKILRKSENKMRSQILWMPVRKLLKSE